MIESPVSELSSIVDCYDIGQLVDWRRNDRGYCNISYEIETSVGGVKYRYFLRKYKQGIKQGELEFEHSLINHLTQSEFGLVARVLKTREGSTYIQRREGEDETDGRFYAIFDFLSGEDRYTWVNPICSDGEIESAAIALARFHNAVYGFSPSGKRDEPGIFFLLPIVAANAVSCAEQARNTVFDFYLQDNLGSILDHIERVRHALEQLDWESLISLVIHCDYHPGNLKFQDDQVVGLFDFDWSKIDVRCFDVALALFYFFVAWEGGQDGALDLDQTARFLQAYQSTLRETHGVGALSDFELGCLPHMVIAGNLYVLNWTIVDYCAKQVNPDEYLIYLRHSVRFLSWVEQKDNWRRLEEIVAACGCY